MRRSRPYRPGGGAALRSLKPGTPGCRRVPGRTPRPPDTRGEGTKVPDGKEPEAAASGERRGPRRLTRIESLLVERGVAERAVLDAVKERQHESRRSLAECLAEVETVGELALIRVLAEATGAEVELSDHLVADPTAAGDLDPDFWSRLGVLPLRLEGELLRVATGDPLNVHSFDEIARATQREVKPILVRPSALLKALKARARGEDLFGGMLEKASALIDGFELLPAGRAPVHAADEHVVDATDMDAPTVRAVNVILADAIARRASDIHIEAEQGQLRIRFRIDGALQEVMSLPANAAQPVLSRIKILGGLDIIETRRPQDGRAKVSSRKRAYDLRISTLPSYFGEKAVIRILDATAPSFELERSGLAPDLLARWRELIRRPNGMLLLTGPTGSGKTSTLYASLLEIRDPSLNIAAVEDPVEYQFPGIVHVPVRSDIGMTFAAALRSILRQEPDVLLVGEIRDAETAQIAVQAAMTGHLVLSTQHTNDAYGAIPRLLDLGIEGPMLASCLAAVMAQRLARTICSRCAEPHLYPQSELAALGALPGASADGVAGPRRGKGCSSCRETGLQGRTAVAELLVMTPALGHLLTRGAEKRELQEQIRRDGTTSLVEAGLRLVLEGKCTPEEILEVAAGEISGASPAEAPDAPPPQPDAVPATPAAPAAAPPESCASPWRRRRASATRSSATTTRSRAGSPPPP